MGHLDPTFANCFAVLFGIELKQAPPEVRSSLELVRTCYSDLQYLVELRNELLSLLQRNHRIIQRVDNIIEAAQTGLVEVCGIVEKCRPQITKGKITLKSRVSWILRDCAEIEGQSPVVGRLHASVLAELNFLRQIALFAPATPTIHEENLARESTQVSDMFAMLGDLTSEKNKSGPKPLVTKSQRNSSSLDTGAIHNLTANMGQVPPMQSLAITSSSRPPPYLSCPSSSVSGVHIEVELAPNPLLSSASTFTVPPDQPQIQPGEMFSSAKSICDRGVVIDSSDADGLSLLLMDYPKAPLSPPLKSLASNAPMYSAESTSLHQANSSVSSIALEDDVLSFQGSLSRSVLWTDSMVSLESSTQRQESPVTSMRRQDQLADNDHRGDRDSISSLSNAVTAQPSPLSQKETALSSPRHLVSRKPLQRHRTQSSSSRPHTSQSCRPRHNSGSAESAASTYSLADPSHRAQLLSNIPSDMIYGQNDICGDSYRPSMAWQGSQNNGYRSHHYSEESSLIDQQFHALAPTQRNERQLIGFENEQPRQKTPDQPPHFSNCLEQTVRQGHSNKDSTVSNSLKKEASGPRGVFEMMGSIPSELRGSGHADASINPLYHSLAAINREPQELSSVRFDLDPIELP
ncbi:hypothetical protein CI238_03358 [Colletotrichum incanum]|uniref:Uncharacterized protein n=1 Tax=Colletotrichum incanum TaxID=1573173 RepID=A0A167B8I1_COLIC|nr:hypothetical protein CI238_03358 [Colletotrichum incanum]